MTDDEPRLCALPRQRAEMMAAVRERVTGEYLRRAEARGSDWLARQVAGVAGSEVARLTSKQARTARDERALAFFGAIARSAAETAQARALLDKVVAHYVSDISGSFDRRLYRVVTGALGPALGLAFAPPGTGLGGLALEARLDVDGPFEQLRALAARGTLLIAPTHSSNADSLVLGMALQRTRLPACAYAAGVHLFRNRLFGFAMERLGAYRIDPDCPIRLYKEVIREYSTILLERGFHSVIFPGATRSRTNEVEPTLKMGLLRTALRAQHNRLRAGQTATPIHVVPVAINYQVVIEAEHLVDYYLAGRARERIVGDELFHWQRIARTARRLWNLDQAVAIRFGQPLEIGPTPDLGARALADALVAAYRRETVFLSTHVVARAVHDLAMERSGARDVHALIGCEPGALSFSAATTHDAIARTLRLLASAPEHGTVHRDLARRRTETIAAAALDAWSACHGRLPVVHRDGRFQVRDAGLLWFYANRSRHVPRGGRALV